MDKKLKRGVDFENRFLEGKFKVQNIFIKRSEKLNSVSFLFVLILFIFNLLIIFPVFTKDISGSFSSSFFTAIDNTFPHFLLSFFGICSLVLYPVSFYIFSRKIGLKHELISFLTTFFLIIPNPLFKGKQVILNAILSGDGGHLFIFSLMPLFLLYAIAFVSKGGSFWGVISSIALVFIAIISPFAVFNTIIFLFVLTVSEGFLGNFRIKIMRFFFIVSASFFLSLFWYNPSSLLKAIELSHVQFAIGKLWDSFPILIPLIPILGSLFFLVFDRRERLRPIFISLSLFLIYAFLSSISSSLNVTGIFTSGRYLMEFSFALSFLLAVAVSIFSEILIKKILSKDSALHFSALFLFSFVSFIFLIFLFTKIKELHEYVLQTQIINNYQGGIGGVDGVFRLNNLSSLLSLLISVLTLIFLIIISLKFPIKISKKPSK